MASVEISSNNRWFTFSSDVSVYLFNNLQDFILVLKNSFITVESFRFEVVAICEFLFKT